MPKDAIYLSGWEYNRLLQNDPTEPCQTMLPGAALWNGGAQFWLFRKVYCTKESLEAEIFASEATGCFVMGKIWQELHERDFLQTFDWKDLKKEAPQHHNRLIAIHRTLREKYDEQTIINLLREGNASELENIKLDLLKPVLDLKGCVQDISPNSIRYWTAESLADKITQQPSATLDRLVRPIIKYRKSLKAGLRLCDPPGTKVNEEQALHQKEVEQRVEKPQIPYLLAGKLSLFEYWKSLMKYRSIYQPINRQLWANWESNRDKLERLRDLAERHLWDDLHKEWLPRLEHEESFYPEFTRLLRDALLQARMNPYLEWATHLAIVAVTTFTYIKAGPGIGLATGYVLHDLHKRRKKETEKLTLFYQEALK